MRRTSGRKKMKERMIGYCGYNCHLCAARSEDPLVRQKLVDGWKRIFGHMQYTVDNVKCPGCLSNGAVADRHCKARPCAISRKLNSCAECGEFICDRVRQLISCHHELVLYNMPVGEPVSEEEYNICVRQFESMPNLISILTDRGRLGKWLSEER